MNTTNKQGTENSADIECKPLPSNMRLYTELDMNGHLVSRELTAYECQLEDDVEHLQEALFTISSQYAKIQFHLRQISSATACEKNYLLKELEDMAAQGVDEQDCRQLDELHSLRCDATTLGNVRAKQQKIICQLRGRLEDLADATGACFQADTTEWSNAYTNQIAAFDLIEQNKVKYMPEKPRERYLSETWSGKAKMQCLNSKFKYVCRGSSMYAKNVEKCDNKLSSRAVLNRYQELNDEDNLLTLRKKKEKQM